MATMRYFALLTVMAGLLLACSDGQPPSANAIRQRDSASVMTTYGVSKLISDSGLIRYKVVADPDGPPVAETRSDTLKYVLCEVLRDLRQAERCAVKYEVKQGCFHITTR